MANLSSNPWSFTSADVVSATPAASPNGLVPIGPGAPNLLTLTTTGAHGLVAGNFATIVGATNAAYNGFYKVIFVGSTTTAILQSISSPASGTPTNLNALGAGSGGGTVALNQYQFMVRGEDISWMDVTANDTLDVRDRNGNIVWKATATASATQTRGKPLWHNGLTLLQMSGGTLIETIN